MAPNQISESGKLFNFNVFIWNEKNKINTSLDICRGYLTGLPESCNEDWKYGIISMLLSARYSRPPPFFYT